MKNIAVSTTSTILALLVSASLMPLFSQALPLHQRYSSYWTTEDGLGITGAQTGSWSTDSNGRWPDTYFVCSTGCPSSGQTNALQYWTYNGSSLPHVNLVVYKCNPITIDGR